MIFLDGNAVAQRDGVLIRVYYWRLNLGPSAFGSRKHATSLNAGALEKANPRFGSRLLTRDATP